MVGRTTSFLNYRFCSYICCFLESHVDQFVECIALEDSRRHLKTFFLSFSPKSRMPCTRRAIRSAAQSASSTKSLKHSKSSWPWSLCGGGKYATTNGASCKWLMMGEEEWSIYGSATSAYIQLQFITVFLSLDTLTTTNWHEFTLVTLKTFRWRAWCYSACSPSSHHGLLLSHRLVNSNLGRFVHRYFKYPQFDFADDVDIGTVRCGLVKYPILRWKSIVRKAPHIQTYVLG